MNLKKHLSAARVWKIGPEDAGTRVDAWLARQPEVASRSRARDWIARGKLFANGDELTFEDVGQVLRAGDEIVLWEDRPGSHRAQPREVVSARKALHVVFEDNDIVVVDKEAGMLVEPLPGEHDEVTVKDLVGDRLKRNGKGRPFVVHRIDRDTTGLVLFAVNERAQEALKRQFERRTAERVYTAVVHGNMRESAGTWTDKLSWDKSRMIQRKARADEEALARQAVATYRVIEQFAKAAVVEVTLETGKRNQIRVQAALRGHPLVGERIYTRPASDIRSRTSDIGRRTSSFARPASADRSDDVIRFRRQALHATRLAFIHPSSGKRLQFTSPLPDDMRSLIRKLRAR